jgi:hypothetical protein
MLEDEKGIDPIVHQQREDDLDGEASPPRSSPVSAFDLAGRLPLLFPAE